MTQPVWKIPVPQEVAGKVVVVVDEIADTGETLAMVADSARALGAVTGADCQSGQPFLGKSCSPDYIPGE